MITRICDKKSTKTEKMAVEFWAPEELGPMVGLHANETEPTKNPHKHFDSAIHSISPNGIEQVKRQERIRVTL